MRCATGGLACVLVVLLGCGVESAREAARKTKDAAAPQSAASPREMSVNEGGRVAPSGMGSGGLPPAVADRKIIFTADLSLVVRDFAAAEKSVPQIVKQHEGYISDAQIFGQSGSQRSGRWTARIPVTQFDGFLEAIEGLGIPESRRQQAQEVTEEYVDLESRIANAKRLEQRMLKLIDERAGSLKDTFELENELNRVRGMVEQMEGRLRVLANRVSLTTVTIAIREEKNYVPPQTPEYSDRLAASWHGSLDSLASAAQNFSIDAAAAAPWIGVWAVVLIPLALVARRQWRKHRPRKTVLPEKQA